MKRKILCFIIAAVLLLYPLTISAAAPSEQIISTEIFRLTNGDYYEITITEETNSSQLFAASSTKKGAKTYTYKNSSGTSLWYVKVTGTFTYNGSSSKCTNSEVTANSKHASWKIRSKSASKSGSSAAAKATAERFANSVTLQTVTKSVTLTCDKSGKLS